ncbi:response regulator transcription factor [Sinorhizobium terangae]|uniref:Response regulator n=1 Tax=Sinorhizobium terangae TaxID=110322 RepID=A0A6N7LQK4_SINTE|nr:response regulator transcription factor [Sinorhizobium terangae]MBB4188889.1 two-component system OmpR family response regulator/two-component system response regulator CpxR [Sinorhizobium terangae]MQX19278.1 response regulator [Sinorhizobium terangae]WFU51245.1 response regulator transcription factor [Sinorhizobium terangae]
MPKVLLIDDDTELTTLLSEYLTEEGFDVETTDDARQGIASAAAGQGVDIIVLDVMMPRMNGIDALQRIRRLGDIPVLMLTAKGDDVDRISGLNLGADDYVSKPCSPGELVARIRAILRRTTGKTTDESETLQAGGLTLNPATRAAIWKGRHLEVTGTEFSILEVLARSAGQLVPKEEISRWAFGRGLTPFDRRIDVHISSVRQKLGLRDDGSSWIQSVRGQGYQLLRDG